MGEDNRRPAARPPPGGPSPTCVLVADAQRLFAEALAIALRLLSFEVLDDHPTTGHGAAKLAADERPDVAIVDAWMADMDGPATARAIRSWAPGTRVLLLSWFRGPSQASQAYDAGAAGYLPKSMPFRQLADAVQRVADGECPGHPAELHRLGRRVTQRVEELATTHARLATLTPRELEILQLLNQGLAAKQVARILSITVGTVKNHIHRILTKTGAATAAEAMAMGRRSRFIGDEWVTEPPQEQPG